MRRPFLCKHARFVLIVACRACLCAGQAGGAAKSGGGDDDESTESSASSNSSLSSATAASPVKGGPKGGPMGVGGGREVLVEAVTDACFLNDPFERRAHRLRVRQGRRKEQAEAGARVKQMVGERRDRRAKARADKAYARGERRGEARGDG